MATKRRKSVRRRSVRRRRRHLGQLAPVAPQPQYIVEESGGSGMIILGLGALAILGIGAVLLLRRAPATATTTSGGAGAGAGGDREKLKPSSLTIASTDYAAKTVSPGEGYTISDWDRGNRFTIAPDGAGNITIARKSTSGNGSVNIPISVADQRSGGKLINVNYPITLQ